jgi:hypothetical protein
VEKRQKLPILGVFYANQGSQSVHFEMTWFQIAFSWDTRSKQVMIWWSAAIKEGQ